MIINGFFYFSGCDLSQIGGATDVPHARRPDVCQGLSHHLQKLLQPKRTVRASH